MALLVGCCHCARMQEFTRKEVGKRVRCRYCGEHYVVEDLGHYIPDQPKKKKPKMEEEEVENEPTPPWLLLLIAFSSAIIVMALFGIAMMAIKG